MIQLAVLQLKIALARLITNFEFELTRPLEEHEPVQNSFMIQMKVSSRHAMPDWYQPHRVPGRSHTTLCALLCMPVQGGFPCKPRRL